MEMDFTVVDLFCGGGGFSEGFRQAGLEPSYAVDVEAGACETYCLNAPNEMELIEPDLSELDELPSEVVVQADLMELEPEVLPSDVDILIGSPPCKEFSASKNGGNGDIEKGMELVDRFLYFVHELDPDYWVMENVPRLDKHLTEYRGLGEGEIPWLDDGEQAHIPKREILECNEYGTPQRRSRLFSGNFPEPADADFAALNFDEVREAFHRPTERYGDSGTVEDPIPSYDIDIPPEKLSDHYYNSHFTEREAKEVRVRKEDHSFYGPMSFPDDKHKPSRTVLAMNRRIARETLVYEEDAPPSEMPSLSPFRKPTLRELATIQGFPITYQFTGTSISQKRRRIGDAVPPTMSYQIARGILEAEGIDTSEWEPQVSETPPEIDYDLSDEDTTPRKRRKLSLSRSFRHHVPYDEMREFRVDLETNDETPRHPLSAVVDEEITHPVGFQVQLYRGYAGSVESAGVPLDRTWEYLIQYAEKFDEQQQVRNFLESIVTTFSDEAPDATTLQAIRSRRADVDRPIEYELLEMISGGQSDAVGVVDKYFPKDEYEDVHLETDILDGTDLPARVLMKMVAAHFVAEKLNNCARWIAKNPEEVYLSDEWDITPVDIPENLDCTNQNQSYDCIEAKFMRAARKGLEYEEMVGRAESTD